MTTTTAERPDLRLATSLKLAPLALAAMLLSAECRADWRFVPTVSVRETYTDNVALERDDVAHDQFISELTPGFTLTGEGPRLALSASGQVRKFGYRDKDAPNLYDSERTYQATARAKVIEDLFYVDAGATRSRRSVSAFDQLSGNPYSSANRTDISTWRVSPYLQHRFGSDATATVRFIRDSVDSTQSGYGSSVSSTTSAELASGTAFTNLGWNLSYTRQDLSNELAGESTSDNAVAGLRYRVIPRLMLTATGGYDSYEYDALSERTSGPSWSAGFIWTPSTRTSVQAAFGHRYFGKTGSLSASHRTRNSVWSLDYSDQITTSRSQFLLPAAIDTAAMLDRLFSASFPDAAQRQQAVQAYMAATGLPASLADSVNYLSNRYIRIKRLQGAAVLRGARSSLALSVFHDQRTALSTQQSDSSLLGNQLALLNDNVRQRGASIDADYRLSPRTSAQASVYVARVQSLDTGVVNNNRQWRFTMMRRISANTRGNLELRHVRGNFGFASDAVYHENSIAATLSVQF